MSDKPPVLPPQRPSGPIGGGRDTPAGGVGAGRATAPLPHYAEPLAAAVEAGPNGEDGVAPARAAGHAPMTSVFGSEVPFVGRRGETEAVYNALRAALNAKQLRMVWLHGPAGLGKTRLLSELRRVVASGGRRVSWLQVTGLDSTAPMSLAGRVLVEMLGGDAAMRQPDAQQQAERLFAEWLGAERAAETYAVAARLLGLARTDREDLAVEPQPPLQVACQWVAALLRQRARVTPTILQVDAECVSAESLHATLSALQSHGGVPLAVVVESLDRPPADLEVVDVPVAPMDVAALTALARKLLRRVEGAPQEIAEDLAARAQGSPEHLLDALTGMVAGGDIVVRDGEWRWHHRTERGTTTSWQSSLVASGGAKRANLPDRIARLPAELRLVVDAAAVFGPSCWFGGVLSVLRGARSDPSESLTERDRGNLKATMLQLQAVDVIVFVEESKLSRELEFTFVHPTDPAVVVAAMDDEKRGLFSRLAAQWLASRPRQDPVADNIRIAELFEAGRRHHHAALAYLEAGHAARTVGQVQRAMALYEAGARNTGPDDAALGCDLRVAHGGALLRLSQHDEAERVLLDAMHMARCLDDDQRCGIVQLRIAQVARVSGRYDQALHYLGSAEKHLKVAGAHRWIADVSDEIGMIYMVLGAVDAYKAALQHFLKALALRRRSQDRRVVARSLCNIARVHLGRGHTADALEAVTEAVQICDQIQERWGAAEARAVLGEVHAAQGKYRLAFVAWDQAAQLSQQVGDRRRRLEVMLLRAETYIALGEWQDAVAGAAQLAELAREVNDPELLSALYRVQASVSLERNALETADLDSDKAVEVARSSGARLAVARALVVRACVLGTRALSDNSARATAIDRKCTEAFEEGLTMLREMGDLVRLASGLRSYVAYLGQRGGGPRLTAVQQRLSEVEVELNQVAGT